MSFETFSSLADEVPQQEGGLDFAIEPRTPTAAFAALALFLVVLIIRPAELISGLVSLRLALVTFALALLLWLVSGKRTVFWQPLTNRFALGLFVCMIVSVPFSVWQRRSVEELIIFAKQLIVFLLVVNLLQSSSSIARLLMVLVVALSFHAVVVVKRYIVGELVLDRVFGAAEGVFSDPNDLALAFVMAFPVTLYLSGRARRGLMKSAWLAFAVLFCVAIVATQSRGGLLGLIGVSGIWLVESRHKFRMLSAIVLGGICVLVAAPEAIERYESIPQYTRDESAQTRLTIWSSGLRMWADHPLTGVGVGAFSTAYGQTYRDPSFPIATWYDAHSAPLKVLAELGALGLIMWSGMVVSGLGGLYRIRRPLRDWVYETRDPTVVELSAVGQALRASLMGYVICCLFLSRSYDWLLMLFLALSVCCISFSRRFLNMAASESSDDVGLVFDEASCYGRAV